MERKFVIAVVGLVCLAVILIFMLLCSAPPFMDIMGRCCRRIIIKRLGRRRRQSQDEDILCEDQGEWRRKDAGLSQSELTERSAIVDKKGKEGNSKVKLDSIQEADQTDPNSQQPASRVRHIMNIGGRGFTDFLVSTLTGETQTVQPETNNGNCASPSRYSGNRSPRTPLRAAKPKESEGLFGLMAKTSDMMGVSSSSNNDSHADSEHVDEVYDEGVDQGLGRINFSVTYEWTVRSLTIKIAQAQSLPAMDFPLGTSDPYCKISILPDKGNKVKTKIKSRKLNPRWNEVFVFEDFPGERLLDRTLFIRVLDYDRFSRDDAIGDVYFPLVFLYDENQRKRSLNVWRQLQPNKKTRGYVGEILVGLGYNPQNSELSIITVKAKQLKAMDLGRTSDPYCIIKLINNKTNKEEEKKKGTIIYKNLNPEWNETFVFSISPDKIHEYHIELVVKDKDFIGSDTIGKIRLGVRSSNEESKHWTEMMNRPRQQIAKWHTLKH